MKKRKTKNKKLGMKLSPKLVLLIALIVGAIAIIGYSTFAGTGTATSCTRSGAIDKEERVQTGNHNKKEYANHSWKEERTRTCVPKLDASGKPVKDSSGKPLYVWGAWSYYHIMPHTEKLANIPTAEPQVCPKDAKGLSHVEFRTQRGTHNDSRLKDHTWTETRTRVCNVNTKQWGEWTYFTRQPHNEPLTEAAAAAAAKLALEAPAEAPAVPEGTEPATDATVDPATQETVTPVVAPKNTIAAGCPLPPTETRTVKGDHGNKNFLTHNWKETRTNTCQMKPDGNYFQVKGAWRIQPHEERLKTIPPTARLKCIGSSVQKDKNKGTRKRFCVLNASKKYQWGPWGSWNKPDKIINVPDKSTFWNPFD